VSTKDKLRERLPPAVYQLARGLRYRLVDTVDRLRGVRNDDMTPPKSLIFVGSGDFKKVGLEFKRYLIELASLAPDNTILDVGCGIARMAVPLTDYLTTGAYEGFDVVPVGIDWSQQHITRRYPNFRFRLVDVRTNAYNPDGKIAAKDFRFPYDDASFDVALLASVFTHMLPDDLENYLAEIGRVLKPGGRSLITWFLLNVESRGLIDRGDSSQPFRHPHLGCLVVDPSDPERSIAYDENRVRDLYASTGQAIRDPIRYGSWSGRPEFLSYQDIVIGVRGN
jgi:SAM-dependent methyltransferase